MPPPCLSGIIDESLQNEASAVSRALMKEGTNGGKGINESQWDEGRRHDSPAKQISRHSIQLISDPGASFLA